jgi:4-amino-4-deoxy-L-arabinose transferase-like glycosyltransferase
VKLSTTAYVDLGLIFFNTASILFIFRWIENDFKHRYLILSAIFCGLAMGTKYNGLVTACLLFLFIPFLFSRLAGSGRRAGNFRPLAYGLIFLLISLAVFSPWMVRNYAWTKNPFYPLYDRWFQPASASEEDRVGIRANTGGGVGLFTKRKVIYGENCWEIALLPIRVFFQGRDGNPQYFDGRMNPFLLILPLFAFLGSKRDPILLRYEKMTLLVFTFLYFAICLFYREMRIRYIALIIPPLLILSAFGVKSIQERIMRCRYPFLRKLGWGILGGGLLFFMVWNAPYLVSYFNSLDPVKYLTGEIGRDKYLNRYVPEYPALQYINAHLPSHSKVFFLFLGSRGYYCDRPYILDRGVGFYRIIKSSKQPEQVVSRLREHGITHLLIRYDLFHKWKRDPILFTNQDVKILNQFMEYYTKPLFFRRNFGVSFLKETPNI